MPTLAEIRDAKKREQMKRAYDEAPYHSMGTTPPKQVKPAPAVVPPPVVAPRAPMPGDMTPEQEDKIRRRLAQEREDKAMDEAHRKAPYESMGTSEYKKGGKVGSASKRADGIAQRGKTRGKYL